MEDLVAAVTDDAIDTVLKTLSAYDQLIEHDVPWKMFKESLIQMEAHNDLSTKNAFLIADIKTEMMNAIDTHFRASETIYEWTIVIVSQLQMYFRLFVDYDDQKAMTQKQLLNNILDSGIVNATLAKLDRITASFGLARKQLTTLRKGNHRDDLSRLGQSLYENIKNAAQHIIYAKQILLKYAQEMADAKETYQETARFVNLNKRIDLLRTISRGAHSLVVKCKAYQKRYTSDN